MKVLVLAVALFSVAAGCPLLARADVITDWNDTAGRAAIVACISPGSDPLHESRMYAMAHLAIHDALNAISRRFHPYALDIHAPAEASAAAAAAAAARDVLVALLGQIPAPFSPACGAAGVVIVEAHYAAALAAIADGSAKTQGIAVGQAAAAVILALRADDGSDTSLLDFAYPQGTNPGEYRSPPGVAFAFAPGWAEVTPFVLRDPSQFRASRPYPLKTKKYTDDFNEVKSLGAKVGSARTADQTEIAHFWVESSPLRWNRIARTVADAAGFGVWENARLFALLNVSLADGYIGSWESKYLYKFWRPVTAIRLADTDGNPHTIADPNWESLRSTPPMPDHDSAHSVQGSAAAEVLKRVFGTDAVAFSVCSLSLLLPDEQCGRANEVLRSYSSFSQAADENGLSRILVGFHFRKAVEDGITHGRRIGKDAVTHLLRPVK
jgi:hypothetical protein